MIKELQINKRVYGISYEEGAWSRYAPFWGNVVSFNETDVVVWGEPPDHDGDFLDLNMEIIFTKRENIYESKEQMQKALKKAEKDDTGW